MCSEAVSVEGDWIMELIADLLLEVVGMSGGEKRQV